MDKNVSTPHRNIVKHAEIIPYVIKSKQINSGNLRNSGGTPSCLKKPGNEEREQNFRWRDTSSSVCSNCIFFEYVVYNFRSEKKKVKIKYYFLQNCMNAE